MKLLDVLEFGGPGSGCHGDDCGRPKSRAMIAKLHYVPATEEMQDKGDEWQKRIAQVINADVTPGNSPADVIKGKNAIEVKTIQKSKKDRVEMRPDSKKRKIRFVRKNHMKGHTVAIDLRGTNPQIYYRRGFGAYRFGSMKKITMDELKVKFSA